MSRPVLARSSAGAGSETIAPGAASAMDNINVVCLFIYRFPFMAALCPSQFGSNSRYRVWMPRMTRRDGRLPFLGGDVFHFLLQRGHIRHRLAIDGGDQVADAERRAPPNRPP